jgi:hypothetical protein
MKKIILFSILMGMSALVSSQVFNSSTRLKTGQFSAGFEPAIITSGNYDDFMLYLHGGYGLKSNIDLGLDLGVLGDENYIGADVEFALSKKFTLGAGFHDFYDFGIDGTALFTFPLTSSAKLSTGLDMDIVFAENDDYVPIWIPINIQIGLKKNMIFMLEANIDTKLIDDSYTFLGGGLQFLF